MTKSQYSKVILVSVIITLFLDIFLGRYLMAKVSTLPILNKLKILSPQAPIVINNRETIRVSDSGDAVSAASIVKSKISSIVFLNDNNNFTITGSAINLTSDGVFLTAITSFAKTDKKYYVLLNDGRTAPVESLIADPATSLVFVKTNLSNYSIVNFANPTELSVGEKVLYVKNSTKKYTNSAMLGFVSNILTDTYSQVYSSDYPKMSFQIKGDFNLQSGEVVVNTNGEVVGMWNGNNIINSNNIKKVMSLYYASPEKIVRPSLGFTYSVINSSESKLNNLPVGVMVKEVTGVNSKQAGLMVGDVIIKIGSKELTDESNLEEILQELKPGEKIELVISRKNQTINLNIIISELKGV